MSSLIRSVWKKGPYLVGSRFSLADIAVCSILAPLLAISGTPWERESFESMSDEYREYQSHLAELPLGQYIQKCIVMSAMPVSIGAVYKILK